ncbi:GNAT family N-acetyltransferase [Granulosicoccus antarcticus]|uniref:N-acetyltransferase domain-containing protein n=1 Tax=Granulosicoccus antarcticus IMCC3135 TaxID=1192854 RepID=A0A2Z2NRG4_9GAMM|nr:GNAT family N-acetyltransferase [Granulosicoccus antarcticus]ASJ72601.1 hypothetical protein IMCC3135_12565 [Granulosicoccus antarcticus IMCC3135]
MSRLHVSSETLTGSLSVSQIVWPEDKDVLQGLHASWIEQYAEYLGPDTAELLVGRLLDSGKLYPEKEVPVLGAYKGETLVGVASLRSLQGLSLITMLEVMQPFRHQGVGRALVSALDKRAERLLAHVSIHRPAVRIFYQQLGFKLLERMQVDHDGHLLEFDVLAK